LGISEAVIRREWFDSNFPHNTLTSISDFVDFGRPLLNERMMQGVDG